MKTMTDMKLNCLFYVGDDKADEQVFAISNPNFYTARIGKSESSRARFYLAQHEINHTLKMLLAKIPASKDSNSTLVLGP